MQHSITQKVIKAVRWTTINTLTQVSVQFLTLIVLGRLLDPKAFGLMAMIMVVVEVVNVFARMGLSEAIIYKKEVSRHEISSLYISNVAVGFLLFCFVFMLSNQIASIYSTPELVPLIKLISTVFFISSIGIIFEILLRKKLLFDIFSKINILSIFVAFIVMTTLACLGYGVYSLIFGQISFHALKSIFLLYIGTKNNWITKVYFKFSDITFFLKFGVYRVLAMSANQINSRIDQLLIGSMLGPVVLGYYNVAFRIIYLPIQRINPILTQVAFPFFSKIQDDNERLKRNFLKYINLILSINTPVLAGITALAHIVIPVFVSDKWLPSVPIIQALSFYVFIRSIFNAGGALMMAKGKASWTFYWNIIMLFVIPTTTYIVLKISQSVIAVSLALGGMFFIFFFLHYYLFLRNLLGGFFKEYMLSIFKPFSFAISMGVILYLLSLLLNSWSKPFLVVFLTSIGFIYYFILTIAFNPVFLDQMEKILPVKVGNALSRLRCMLKPSHAF